MRLLSVIPFRLLLISAILFSRGSSVVASDIDRGVPNIIFAIADDASWRHFGAYGCRWVKTPAFDRVAEQGLLFNRAYTPNAKCSPSRSSIITGLNSWQLKAAANHVPFFPEQFLSMFEVLKSEGFFVGYTGKGWAPGRALDSDGNRRELTGRAYNGVKLSPPTKMISDVNYIENFKEFIGGRDKGQPFCFWYGAKEPHRAYEYGSGIDIGGKRVEDIDEVPGFWPDVDTIRTDMLDYAFEIEHFDSHLLKMIEFLEEIDELDNTIIVVTSDNGMPFPRVKGQVYEYSNHLPLAIMWPAGILNPGREIDDLVSFIDFAPTFLDISNVDLTASNMHPMEGRSLSEIFNSDRCGRVIEERDFVLVGKERHDLGRPNDWGYPVRGIIKDGYLYLHNYNPERWPAGNPETGYLNCDGGATKTYILNQRRFFDNYSFWNLNFGKRNLEEFYDIVADPLCMNNLIDSLDYSSKISKLKRVMIDKLIEQNDPRVLGDGDIFLTYPYAEKNRNMYEKLMSGESVNTGWVNRSDFESEWIDK